MADTFRAVYLTEVDGKTHSEIKAVPVADLPGGDVTVAVSHSTINYKDGLAITGRGKIVRKFPFVPGIDIAGTVEASDNPDWRPGDAVVLNGWGVGEGHWGGLGTRARVKGDWLIRRPAAFTAAQTMAIGTAGYTAMLSVLALEKHGLTPDRGEILVTGAAGGVGSVAIALLAKMGFTVVASTGRAAEADWLKALGAATIIDRAELSGPAKPLAKERWAGLIDTVGSTTLANALSQLRYNGAAAACGLAQGADLPGSVFPFILRGVTLYGIDSVMAPRARREEAWARLATDLDKAKLQAITRTEGLDAVPALAHAILDGKVRGRVVIDVNG
jgi:acrylyl-CoA reductase (NADPH)